MNKHYAVTDIHGMYNLWEMISDYCDESDVIYFLGDAADRGPNGYKVLKELLTDDRVVFIKGNHEQLMEDCLRNMYDYESWALWAMNGGQSTMDDITLLSADGQVWFLNKLMNLPTRVMYINKKGQCILLSHAGYSPWIEMDRDDHDFMWDRKHFLDQWPEGDDWANTYVVHGHTPIPHILREVNNAAIGEGLEPPFTAWNKQVLYYAQNHKVDLDLASFQTNRVALFDLDEMKTAKYFGSDEYFLEVE